MGVDWDGIERHLSALLGTDADVIYHGLEYAVERELLMNAVRQLSKRDKPTARRRYGLGTVDGQE